MCRVRNRRAASVRVRPIKFRVTLFWALVGLAACGGRVAQPVAVANDFDDRLSCSHLRGERDNNNKRLEELVGERAEATRDNLGFLVVSPFFLDFSDTWRKETEAMVARNARLAQLMAAGGCAPEQAPVEAASAAADGDASSAEDEASETVDPGESE